MNYASLLLLAVSSFLLLYFIWNECVRFRRRIGGIPGPPGLPIIGNAPETYRQWSLLYGPVIQVMLGNEPTVVINSAKAAQEIFLSHGSALSSRPSFYTFHKVVSSSAGLTIGTSPACPELRRRRKAAASALNRPSVASYFPMLQFETSVFLKDLLEQGGHGLNAIDCLPLIQRLTLNLMLALNWGDRVCSTHDSLFKEIIQCEETISRFRSATGTLQDFIPILRFLPFNTISSKAIEMRSRRDAYLRHLNSELLNKISSGVDMSCIQAHILGDADLDLKEEDLLSLSLTMLSSGFALSTTIIWAVKLLSVRADIQEKAWSEIHRVYGNAFPDAEADGSVPYIMAFTREVLRYFTALRLALPRSNQSDVRYNQILIPRGSTIFLNAWACNMDPDAFDEPHTFCPERFLLKPDLPIFTYGLGGRMCVGYILGNRQLYILFLRLISTFRIIPDPQTKISSYDPVNGVFDSKTLVSQPKRFRCHFIPRNDKIKDWLSGEIEVRGGVDKGVPSGNS